MKNVTFLCLTWILRPIIVPTFLVMKNVSSFFSETFFARWDSLGPMKNRPFSQNCKIEFDRL